MLKGVAAENAASSPKINARTLPFFITTLIVWPGVLSGDPDSNGIWTAPTLSGSQFQQNQHPVATATITILGARLRQA